MGFSVPMDFINYYRMRVSFMNRVERENFKAELGERARSIHLLLRNLLKDMEGKEHMPRKTAEPKLCVEGKGHRHVSLPELQDL